jgi:hypothetical protein
VIVTAGFDYFYLTGGLGVAFALIIAILGLTHSSFPGRRMPVLMAISVLLFLAGIIGAAAGAKFKAGERHGPPKSTPVAGHNNE